MGQRLENPRPSWPDMGFGSCSGGQNNHMRSIKQRKPTETKEERTKRLNILCACFQWVVKSTGKTIRPFDLRNLGYVFHNTPRITDSKCDFELRQVLHEDTGREASFSYFLCTSRNEGSILPHSFTHYVETYEESPTSQDATVVKGESPTGTANA
jgi:hypothetical protein